MESLEVRFIEETKFTITMPRETLDAIAQRHMADKSSLYHGYAPIYDGLFSKFRDDPIALLEIGVQFGASIRVWLDYFTKASIYGLDVNNEASIANGNYTFTQANQRNPDALKSLGARSGGFTVIIDDGCHEADAMAISFGALWPFVKEGGYYIIEDVFTVYHPFWKNPRLDGPDFIKSFVDDVNWRGKQFHGMPNPNAKFTLTMLEQTIKSVSYHKGLVVIEHR